MRLAFTVIALLVIGYLVLNVAQKQARVLVPRAAASAASAAAQSASNLPQQVQQDVQKMLELGAQRASGAAP